VVLKIQKANIGDKQMGFQSDMAGLFMGQDSVRDKPTTVTQEGYTQGTQNITPTFSPSVYGQILGALPKVDVEGMMGYGMSYDPATGKLITKRGGSPNAGGAYADKMKRYIESMGSDVYNKQVLPSLQARGILSRPGRGQTSREESQGTQDWGRMMTQQGLQAGSQGIQLEQAAQKDLLSQLQTALGVSAGAVTPATGKNIATTGKQWGTQSTYM
jgi:hypothetical protein